VFFEAIELESISEALVEVLLAGHTSLFIGSGARVRVHNMLQGRLNLLQLPIMRIFELLRVIEGVEAASDGVQLRLCACLFPLSVFDLRIFLATFLELLNFLLRAIFKLGGPLLERTFEHCSWSGSVHVVNDGFSDLHCLQTGHVELGVPLEGQQVFHDLVLRCA